MDRYDKGVFIVLFMAAFYLILQIWRACYGL